MKYLWFAFPLTVLWGGVYILYIVFALEPQLQWYEIPTAVTFVTVFIISIVFTVEEKL